MKQSHIQRTLRQLCVERVKENMFNDKIASHIAATYLEVTAREETFSSHAQESGIVARGNAAAFLLDEIEEVQERDEHAYPKTKTILWKAICLGWLSAKDTATENFFARIILTTSWIYMHDEAKEAMKFLRECLGDTYAHTERCKRLVSGTRKGDNDQILRIVGHFVINNLEADELARMMKD